MATWLLARRPVTGKSFAQMLPFTAADSDYFNHFALFDAIRRIGGYPFLKPDQSRPFESTTVYPPGTHYLYALIDVFRTSSSDPGDSVHEFLRFNQYHALGLSLLSFTVVWAARWIAGPSAIGWHRALVCAVVAAFTVLGQLSTLFPQAFVAEIAGLVLLALTIALLARPPSSPHEQVLVAAALLVALTFVYPIFLVDAGFAILFALLVYQSRIRRIPRFTAALTIVTATLCAFPLWQTLHVPNVTRAFALSGFFIAFSRPISVIFALFGIGALFTATGRRLPTWQVASPVVALACAVALYAELAGTVATGSPQYYSSKMVAAALVISLCGFGGVTLFFKSLRRPGTYSLHDALIPGALCVVLAILLPVAQGHANIRAPRAISDYASAGGKFGDGVPTAVVTSRYRETNRGMTMFLAVLNHQAGTMDADALDSRRHMSTEPATLVDGLDEALVLLDQLPTATSNRPLDSPAAAALSKVENWIRSRPPGFRMAVANPAFADVLRQFSVAEPALRLSVFFVPTSQP
jgi:hypothetical protein